MNQSILIRCVAAALVAAVALPAQGAPVSPPKAAHAEQQGPAQAGVQARLSEVIELLAKDDLSPEQRAEAKKALEEIAAQLRQTPVAGPRPPKPPKAPKPAKAPKPGAVEVAPPEPMEPPEPVAPAQARRPRVFRSVATPGEPVEMVEVTPEGERPADVTMARRHAEASRKAAEEARTRMKVAEGHAEADKTARAGRLFATRAPVDHARKAEIEAREHAEHAKTKRGHFDPEAKGPDTWTTRRKVELIEGEGDDAEIRAVIEEMRREMREIRELMQQLREKAQGRAPGQGSGAAPGRFGQMGGDVRAGHAK